MDVDKDIDKIREQIPVTKLRAYFDTASVCPGLIPVWKAIKDWWAYRLFASQRTLEEVFVWRYRSAKAKKEAARLINAKEEEISWIARVTQAINIVRDVIDWKKGDNMVANDLVYSSNMITWTPLRKKGVEIRRVKNINGKILLSDIEKAIDNRTRLVTVGATSWTTGFSIDLKALSKMAHEHGALVNVDAYQTLGAIPLNVQETGVDFMEAGSNKWLCGPFGAGIFYINEKLVNQLDPTYFNYDNIKQPFSPTFVYYLPTHDTLNDYEHPFIRTAQKFDMGVVWDNTLWGFNAALKFLNDLGIKNIGRRVRRLSGYLIEQLQNIGCKVITPVENDRRAGLVVYTSGSHKDDFKNYNSFNTADIGVSLRYAGGVGGMRVSTHFFNTEEEIDRLITIQKLLMKHPGAIVHPKM